MSKQYDRRQVLKVVSATWAAFFLPAAAIGGREWIRTGGTGFGDTGFVGQRAYVAAEYFFGEGRRWGGAWRWIVGAGGLGRPGDEVQRGIRGARGEGGRSEREDFAEPAGVYDFGCGRRGDSAIKSGSRERSGFLRDGKFAFAGIGRGRAAIRSARIGGHDEARAGWLQTADEWRARADSLADWDGGVGDVLPRAVRDV